MSDSNNCCSDLMLELLKQNNQLIQQNQRLIEQHEVKDEIILQSLQQNNELIAQMYEQEDEPEGSKYLDG